MKTITIIYRTSDQITRLTGKDEMIQTLFDQIFSEKIKGTQTLLINGNNSMRFINPTEILDCVIE